MNRKRSHYDGSEIPRVDQEDEEWVEKLYER